jgi:hypothetical protein
LLRAGGKDKTKCYGNRALHAGSLGTKRAMGNGGYEGR